MGKTLGNYDTLIVLDFKDIAWLRHKASGMCSFITLVKFSRYGRVCVCQDGVILFFVGRDPQQVAPPVGLHVPTSLVTPSREHGVAVHRCYGQQTN